MARPVRLRRSVATEFVFGDRFYEGEPSVEMQRRLAEESQRHGDVIFVDAREKLPHGQGHGEIGGVVADGAAPRPTPASSARRTTIRSSTTITSRSALAAAEEAAIANQRQAATGGGGGSGGGGGGGGSGGKAATPNVLFSYVRWRGWLPGTGSRRGGGWGGPIDCIRHMTDPSEQCPRRRPLPPGDGPTHLPLAASRRRSRRTRGSATFTACRWRVMTSGSAAPLRRSVPPIRRPAHGITRTQASRTMRGRRRSPRT